MTNRTHTIEIKADSLLPPRVSSGEIELAHYTICPCGLASATVGNVIIDRRIALIQPNPESILYLCPLRPNPHPTNAEAWFYNDCISYEHDLPSIVCQSKEQVADYKHRYLHSGPSKPREYQIINLGKDVPPKKFVRHPIPPDALPQTFLVDQLLSILEETRELRHGPNTYVFFRTHRYRRRVYLDYSKLYGSVSKEISLYSAALRQADFLFEYLGYYRVIESATGSNGKRWITDALDRINYHRFRKVLMGHQMDDNYCPKNIILEYHKRAKDRLRQLKKAMQTNVDLARYFYNTNRCGIAHGRGQVIKADITPSYFDIALDTVVLKLLSRMAIDEKNAP